MLEFSSKEELYIHIKPALYAKKQELKKEGYFYIKEIDVWNYLIKTKWKDAHGLMLSDIVNDVLKVENQKIDMFVKEQLEKQEILLSNLELL